MNPELDLHIDLLNVSCSGRQSPDRGVPKELHLPKYRVLSWRRLVSPAQTCPLNLSALAIDLAPRFLIPRFLRQTLPESQ